MRITLVISTFGIGGADRVLSIMANYWTAQGHDISLISLSPLSNDMFKLHPRVKRIGLNLLNVSTQIGQRLFWNVRRVTQLRLALRRSQPDVAISFIDTSNVLTLMASWRLGFPVIVGERNDPRQHSIGPTWNLLRSLLYRYASAVVIQSSQILDWASRHVERNNVYVIPNPTNPELKRSVKASNRHGAGHTVVAVGRLARQKGFDLLIPAFGCCAAKHVGWSLVIVGEGEERTHLEILAATIGIADRVKLIGTVRNPFPLLREADLFVLSSRYEGFPNVLVEAMACGLPVISTDCPTGPSEIIRNDMDGVLVPLNDVEALTAAMDRLMADPMERQRLAARAVDVFERFSIEKVMGMWDEVATHAWRRVNR